MDYVFSNRIASLKPSLIREILKSASDPNLISFAAGNPATESFPVEDIRRISAEILQDSAATALQYGISEGYTPLRETLAARMREKYGVGNSGDDLVIVSGAQQGIELSCKVLCNEGDTVLCENPSFIGALNAFRSYRVNLRGVPVEEDGISVEGLEQALREEKRTKLLYLIPTFQNPTGITMSLEKRRAVYGLAKKYGVMILEDNPYADLRFAGDEIPCIKTMDEDGLVIYCGSFSKVLSAGMRVGYVVAPRPVISKIVVAKQVSDVHTNLFFQMLTYSFMTQCDLDAHIDRIRAIYRHKCSLMLGCMERFLRDGSVFTRPQGGLFIWCTLPEGKNMLDFCKKAAAAGVAVVPGAAFCVSESDPCSSYRLNYSTPSDEQIEKGIEILGKISV